MKGKVLNTDELVEDMLNHKGSIKLSQDGSCNNCNECCSILSPVTSEELKILKRLFTKKIEKNYIKYIEKHRLIGLVAVCPFSCYETKRCLIYHLRPTVCKKYHCNPDYSIPPKMDDFSKMKGRFRYIYEILPNNDLVEKFAEITNKVIDIKSKTFE